MRDAWILYLCLSMCLFMHFSNLNFLSSLNGLFLVLHLKSSGVSGLWCIGYMNIILKPGYVLLYVSSLVSIGEVSLKQYLNFHVFNISYWKLTELTTRQHIKGQNCFFFLQNETPSHYVFWKQKSISTCKDGALIYFLFKYTKKNTMLSTLVLKYIYNVNFCYHICLHHIGRYMEVDIYDFLVHKLN